MSVADAPDPALDPVTYLRSINAVRERSRLVLQKAHANQLNHFEVDLNKFPSTANYVVSIIKRDFKGDYKSIPPHGRWQHFDVGGRPRVDQLLQSWPDTVDAKERTRRLVDLFLVSVLLDAGAGTRWSYRSQESGEAFGRSEGLAVASLEMFKMGTFSSDPSQPFQVDATGLEDLTAESLAKGMQVSESNPMSGLEGRAGLLIRLAKALGNPRIFGPDGRPGNMIAIGDSLVGDLRLLSIWQALEPILQHPYRYKRGECPRLFYLSRCWRLSSTVLTTVDYLLSHPTTTISSAPVISLPTLWSVLMDGLSSIWPATRTQVNGVSLGDAWPCSSMPSSPPAQVWENIVPFHKLTQWLCYSLMVPMLKLLNFRFLGSEMMTGLPEYRNGGLLVDTGLLKLKEKDFEEGIAAYKRSSEYKATPSGEVVPLFEPADDVIVEWRAVTVGFLDELLVEVNKSLGLTGKESLSLPQMLEAGTWKGGREIAATQRPQTKGPPIAIVSDGTVF